MPSGTAAIASSVGPGGCSHAGLRGSVGDILAAPGGAEAIARYLDARIAVATKEGYAPRAAAIERFRAMLCKRPANPFLNLPG